MKINERIRLRRIELGLTQAELASKLGYKSRSAITRIETGENDLTQTKIFAFAKALDITPGYLVGWDDLPDKDYVDEILERYQKETGSNVEFYREEKGFSRSKLASMVSISEQMITGIECGNIYVEDALLDALAIVLCVNWDDLDENRVRQPLPSDKENLSKTELVLLSYFRALNEIGQDHVVEYIENMAAQDKYKKRNIA